MTTNDEAKTKIFTMLINCQISTYTSLYAPNEAVVTISNIVNSIDGMTRYRARKALKALIEDGTICYKSQGCPAIVSCGEYQELIAEAAPPINGYTLTPKGYETEDWEQAYRSWEQSLREWSTGESGKEEEDG